MGKGNFKVGDMVKVVSPLRTYSTYELRKRVK